MSGPDRERIAVAMSGGVDSAVAAYRIVEAGADAVGFFLKNGVSGLGRGAARSCCSASDAADARVVADRLGIPFYSLDVSAPFEEIIARFVSEYREGRTPNPCVQCNVQVKFGHLLDMARSIDAERVVTGHYARVRVEGDRAVLSRSADRTKDQSYVLSTLAQDQLRRADFPLGGLTKEDVRRIAREASLPVADKPESQEICFVPSGDYRDLVDERSTSEPGGEIVTTSGHVVGRHDGISRFTVGQRRGLGVAASGAPKHVIRIEPDTRRVVIGSRDEASHDGFELTGANWVKVAEPDVGRRFDVTAQVRHRHRPVSARAEVTEPGRVRVSFLRPEFAITPGQTAALYDGDDVLVAGTIDRVV